HPTSPAPAWSIDALLTERSPATYLWDPGAWWRHDAHPGVNAYNNKLATQFAERAILAQPVDYLKTVGEGVFLTFLATDRSQSYLSDHFTVAPHVATLAPYVKSFEYRYAHTTSNTHVVQPWAYFMFLYQMPVWFPGVVFLAVMVAGLVMLILLWGGVQTRIVDARKGDDLYLIPADGDPLPPPGTAVRGAVEDDRRTALMRTHSGLHVLCGVVFRDFGALVTGGNMEPLTARMDFNLPDVPAGFREEVESACNAEVQADRRIDARVLPREEAFALPDIIRTATNLVPPDVKEVRIIDIVGLDQQADGGTHVASTRQVGRIEVVKIESKGK